MINIKDGFASIETHHATKPNTELRGFKLLTMFLINNSSSWMTKSQNVEKFASLTAIVLYIQMINIIDGFASIEIHHGTKPNAQLRGFTLLTLFLINCYLYRELSSLFRYACKDLQRWKL